jgi:hypothetical protein
MCHKWKRIILLACTSMIFFSCTKNIQQISSADADAFDGNEEVELIENEALVISRNDLITADIAIPKNSLNPTIVLVLHGNHSRKEAHRNHIIELAKNGFIGIALQFRNTGQWHLNGRLLARSIPKLKSGMKVGVHRIKSNDIILVGHSFGGYASSIAAGTYQNLKGVILLDPAMFDKKGPEYLAKISAPTIIIGADKKVFRSRKRDLFFKNINNKKIEFSVLGATHDDAQNPSMFAISSYGVDPYTSGENQELITQLIIEGAHALTKQNGLKKFRNKILLLEKQSKVTNFKSKFHSSLQQN